jgi:hypothetical protein
MNPELLKTWMKEYFGYKKRLELISKIAVRCSTVEDLRKVVDKDEKTDKAE